MTATQSPWRLLSAGFAGVDFPPLIPWDLSFLTAQRGFGFHTPHISDAGCAIGTYGVRFRVQVPPLGVLLLLDRAYVAPIYASFPASVGAWRRLSTTDIRALLDRDTTGVRPDLF